MTRAFVVALFMAVALAMPPPLTPWMGWSSWCTDNGVVPCYDDMCTEAEILSVAQALVTNGMHAKGFTMISLDDCWASNNRSSTQRIQANATRFPSGMKALTDKLHSMGFYFSLYTDIGPKTVRARWRYACGALTLYTVPRWPPRLVALLRPGRCHVQRVGHRHDQM